MKKRILAIVLGTAMTLSMVGCGGTNEETPATTPDTKAPAASTEEAAAPAETRRWRLSLQYRKSFQATYWQAAVKGIETACGELGVTANANGPANESDIADQVQMLNDAIQKAPDGIGLAACDTKIRT